MKRVLTRWSLNSVLPAALATAAFVTAVTDSTRFLALLLATACLGVLLWRSRSLAIGPGQAATKVVLAAAVTIGYPASGTVPDGPLLLASALLVGLLLHEGLLFRAGRPLYRAAHLPAPETRLGDRIDRQAASIATTAVLAAFVLLALVQSPSWPVLGLAAVAALVNVGALRWAIRHRLLGRARELAALRQRLSDYEPTFMLYFSAPPGSNYQLMMWLPHLERVGERYVVVLREPHSFRAVAAATEAPVLYTPEMSTFDACVVPSLKAVFYVNNGAKNTHCVRYGELTHAFLNHGDSDKVSSFNPVTAMYDRVFVAGQAGIDRYRRHGVEIPLHKFRIVGRPQVAEVRPPERLVEEVDEPVVLYAPTWTGHYADANYSSLPIAVPIVRALLARGATVLLRHHPYTTRNRADAAQLREAQQLLAADAARTGRPHRWGEAATAELSLIDCFNMSDALITDVSSVASEYLYSEKPFAITDMLGQAEGFAETFPLARVSYVIDREANQLPDVLDQLLKRDPDRQDRLLAKVHYLGHFPRETYAAAFVAEARACLA